MGDFESQPIYHPETGEQIGERFQLEDGRAADVDHDSRAWNAETGEYIGLMYEDGDIIAEPGYAEQLAYDQRLEELEQYVEQRAAEPPEPTDYFPDPEADSEHDANALLRGREDLERVYDMKLTLGQKHKLAERLAQQHAIGEDPDPIVAAADLEELGDPLPDLDSGTRGQRHEKRVEQMTQGLLDQERYQANARGEDDLSPERPAQRDEYDFSNREQKTQWYEDAMRGATDASTLVDNNDTEEWE